MKPYLLSLGAGLLVGLIYALLGVRSPAPPALALLGLLGMLMGEQVLPLAKQLAQRHAPAHTTRPPAEQPAPLAEGETPNDRGRRC